MKKINFNCNVVVSRTIVNFLRDNDLRSLNENNIVLTQHCVNAIRDDKYLWNEDVKYLVSNFIDLICKNNLFIFEVVWEINNRNNFDIEKIGVKFRYKNRYVNLVMRKVRIYVDGVSVVKYKVITMWCNHINDKHQTLRNRSSFIKDLETFNKSKVEGIYFKFS